MSELVKKHDVLPTLAGNIMRAHAEAERSLRSSVEHAIRAGELLLQAKKTCGHGSWSIWLRDNIDFSERLAQAYTGSVGGRGCAAW